MTRLDCPVVDSRQVSPGKTPGTDRKAAEHHGQPDDDSDRIPVADHWLIEVGGQGEFVDSVR